MEHPRDNQTGDHRSLVREDRGVSAVLVAVSLLVMLMMAAVAIDGSNLYRERGDAQNAADHAALAAAYEECTSDSVDKEAEAIAAGQAQAVLNGFDDADPNVTVSLAKEGEAWRSDIETTIGGFFSVVIGVDTLTTGAEALASCRETTGPLPVIFAGGQCGTDPTFDVGGDTNTFDGDFHSNGNLKWQGADDNYTTGLATFVDPYYEPTNEYGSGNTWDQGVPTQDVWKPWPSDLQLDPDDFLPGGPVDLANPGAYFSYSGDQFIGSSALPGVHVIVGDGKFSFQSGLVGQFTFVTLPATSGNGQIEISANDLDLEAFHDDILFFSNHWKTGEAFPYDPPPYDDPAAPECGAPAISFSGEFNTFDGFFVSPRGQIVFNGNFTVMTGGLAGWELKYNGNDNAMMTLSGEEGGDIIVELLE